MGSSVVHTTASLDSRNHAKMRHGPKTSTQAPKVGSRRAKKNDFVIQRE